MKRIKSMQVPLAIMLALILTISFSCNNASNTLSGLLVDTLNLADAKMQSFVDEGKLSGISVLVIKDGKSVHQRTFGLAHLA
jgi:CubicO group peptidase (beta-lactamase class C family)